MCGYTSLGSPFIDGPITLLAIFCLILAFASPCGVVPGCSYALIIALSLQPALMFELIFSALSHPLAMLEASIALWMNAAWFTLRNRVNSLQTYMTSLPRHFADLALQLLLD